MPQTISASEARNRFGTWLKYIAETDDDVIVEHRGKSNAAIMSISAI